MLLALLESAHAGCPATVTADELVYQDGAITAEEVVATTCCDDTWTLDARSAVVDGESVVLRGATARVKGVPVFWTPWARIQLGEERRHVGVPVVGRGLHGWQLAVPFVDEGPGHRLELAPEVRQAGVVRGLASMETALGQADAAVTHDGRGAVDGQLSGSIGEAQAGWTGALVSDADWLGEFGDSWLGRSQDWTRSTWAVQGERLGVEGLIWQDASTHAAVGLPARIQGERASAGGRLDVVGDEVRAQVDVEGRALYRLGAVEADIGGGARAFSVLDSSSMNLDTVVDMAWGLPFHAVGPRATWVWEPALVSGAGMRFVDGATLDAVDPFLAADPLLDWRSRGWLDDRAPTALWIGPELAVSRGSTRARVSAPLTSDGPLLAGGATSRRGPLTGSVQGTWTPDDWLASARLGVDAGRAHLSLGSVDGPDLHLWRGGVDVQIGQLRPGVGAVVDPQGLDEATVRLGWCAECGCLAVDGRVGWAEDRDGLVGGVAVQVR